MSDAAIGYGSTFSIGNGASPQGFGELAEVVTITPPGFTMDEVDVTHLQSPDQFREVIGTIKDATEVSMTANATAANVAALYAAADGLVRDFRIDSNQQIGLRWNFRGFIQNVTPGELSNDDRLTIEITVRVSGSTLPVALP